MTSYQIRLGRTSPTEVIRVAKMEINVRFIPTFLAIVLAFSSARAQPLVVSISGDEGFLTPFTYVTGYPGYNLLSLVYDTLMLPDLNGVVQPWLAEQVRSSNGGREWTIRLKAAQWHDGKPITSEDVKFSYEYYRRYPVVGRFATAVRLFSQIRAPDSRTVVISLPRPDANFELTTLADVPILPKHIWENVTDPKGFRNNIGSGPFMLVEVKSGQFIALKPTLTTRHSDRVLAGFFGFG